MTKPPPKRIWIIRHDGSGFTITSPEGDVTKGLRPKKLSSYAFEKGADEVKHDYHLGLDPDL